MSKYKIRFLCVTIGSMGFGVLLFILIIHEKGQIYSKTDVFGIASIFLLSLSAFIQGIRMKMK